MAEFSIAGVTKLRGLRQGHNGVARATSPGIAPAEGCPRDVSLVTKALRVAPAAAADSDG